LEPNSHHSRQPHAPCSSMLIRSMPPHQTP
jgi:hypothetical protein